MAPAPKISPRRVGYLASEVTRGWPSAVRWLRLAAPAVAARSPQRFQGTAAGRQGDSATGCAAAARTELAAFDRLPPRCRRRKHTEAMKVKMSAEADLAATKANYVKHRKEHLWLTALLRAGATWARALNDRGGTLPTPAC